MDEKKTKKSLDEEAKEITITKLEKAEELLNKLDPKYKLQESVLRKVFADYPGNSDHDEVYCKLALVDAFYSTNCLQMSSDDFEKIVNYINLNSTKVDECIKSIEKSAVEIVDNIIKDIEIKKDYALLSKFFTLSAYFAGNEASKFCIHDSIVREDFQDYNNTKIDVVINILTDKKSGPKSPKPKNYEEYCKIINDFIDEESLRDCDFVNRRLDWYIWSYGKKRREKEEEKK